MVVSFQLNGRYSIFLLLMLNVVVRSQAGVREAERLKREASRVSYSPLETANSYQCTPSSWRTVLLSSGLWNTGPALYSLHSAGGSSNVKHQPKFRRTTSAQAVSYKWNSGCFPNRLLFVCSDISWGGYFRCNEWHLSDSHDLCFVSLQGMASRKLGSFSVPGGICWVAGWTDGRSGWVTWGFYLYCTFGFV